MTLALALTLLPAAQCEELTGGVAEAVARLLPRLRRASFTGSLPSTLGAALAAGCPSLAHLELHLEGIVATGIGAGLLQHHHTQQAWELPLQLPPALALAQQPGAGSRGAAGAAAPGPAAEDADALEALLLGLQGAPSLESLTAGGSPLWCAHTTARSARSVDLAGARGLDRKSVV